MDLNPTKCFICDVECVAEKKYLGTSIARTLTMPMATVLAKCLRTVVDTDNEYFCGECTRKIEEYDKMVQLTLQIQTELYELYRKKPIESCYLLDAEIISDADINNDGIIETHEVKIESNEYESENEPYDEMVIEYLDEYDAHSEDNGVLVEENYEFSSDKLTDGVTVTTADQENDNKSNNLTEEPSRKTRTKKKASPKGRNKKKKISELKEEDGDIDLNCKLCAFTGGSREALEEHKTIEHFEEIKRLTCDICGRTYKSKSALCVHLGMHNGRSAHECHICGKSFTQRGALVRHMPMHTGERPHQCDVCGKRFIHYSSFHMHQMIHTNERKKKCEICGSEFRSNSHMTRHMRSHTGERPYACSICGQRFAQRYNMKTHFNTHQGIHRPQARNHKCLICMDAFPRREKLNKHLRQVHRISDEDITTLAEHGPDSEITQKIIERLKSTKEEAFVEFVEVPAECITTEKMK